MSQIGAQAGEHLHDLVAKLPQLGPLIGWRHAGKAARLWAKADENYTGRAVLALTVAVQNDHLDMASVKFWKTLPVKLVDTKEGNERVLDVQRFALADVDLPAAGEVIRMVMLHVEHRLDSLPPIYGNARNFGNPIARDVAADRLPDAEELRYEEFAGAVPIKPKEQFVEELFDELERELHVEREIGAAPIPGTYSRLRRRDARMSRCEVSCSTLAGEGLLAFAAACCRHPGVGFDRDLADRALAALAARVDPSFVFMLGDQIYADATAGVLDVDERVEKYAARYDMAFGSDGFRRLAARLPVYMVADDHEVRDNWPNDVLPPSARPYWDDSVEWAWQLYFAHQRWHGPQPPPAAALAKPAAPTSFYYSFADRGIQFFAFDSRFEREPGGGSIVGAGQMEALSRWLDQMVATESLRCVPKFVACGTVFAPGLEEFRASPERTRRADTWQAFQADRAKVARLIAEKGAQNVVFLSGDYHCAAIGSLRFFGGKAPREGLRGYAIVAPPFYAPFPFANNRECDVASNEVIVDPATKQIVASCTSLSLEMQGFAVIRVNRVEERAGVDQWKIEVQFQTDRWAQDGSATADKIKTGLLANGTASWVT